MKQKLDKVIVLFTFIMAGILLNSCQKDDLDDLNKRGTNGYNVKEYTLTQAKELPRFQKSYTTILNRLNNMKFSGKSSTPENDTNFVIDPAKIKEIVTENVTTYTMLIHRPESNDEFFENLVIQINAQDSTKAYIVKYFPDREIGYNQEHNTPIFHGTNEIKEIVYDSSYMSLFLFDEEPCVLTLLCDYGGSTHDAGPNCTHVYMVAFCPGGGDSSSDSDSSNDTNNSNTGGDTGGVNGPGGGSAGSGVVTSTVSPCPKCPNAEVYQIENAKNCEKLKKLTDPLTNNTGAQTVNPVKTALVTNQNQVTENNNEQGFRLFYDQATNSFVITPVTSTNNNDCGSLDVGFNNATVGFFHSHPNNCSSEGLYEMFSHKDILKLAEAIRKHNGGNPTYPNGTPVDYSNFVITVATVNGTYAIKITDIDKFKSIAANAISSQENLNKFLKEFEEMQSDNKFASGTGVENTDSSLNEKNMLNILNNLFGNSLSLHRAKSNFTGWDRLVIENHVVTPKSCN